MLFCCINAQATVHSVLVQSAVYQSTLLSPHAHSSLHVLTFLCWRSWEFLRSHRTKAFQTVLQPSIVSSSARCLGSRHFRCCVILVDSKARFHLGSSELALNVVYVNNITSYVVWNAARKSVIIIVVYYENFVEHHARELCNKVRSLRPT